MFDFDKTFFQHAKRRENYLVELQFEEDFLFQG